MSLVCPVFTTILPSEDFVCSVSSFLLSSCFYVPTLLGRIFRCNAFLCPLLFVSYVRFFFHQGACLALNAERWSAGMSEICARHSLPCPSFDEKLPVGTGSNPVRGLYLVFWLINYA